MSLDKGLDKIPKRSTRIPNDGNINAGKGGATGKPKVTPSDNKLGQAGKPNNKGKPEVNKSGSHNDSKSGSKSENKANGKPDDKSNGKQNDSIGKSDDKSSNVGGKGKGDSGDDSKNDSEKNDKNDSKSDKDNKGGNKSDGDESQPKGGSSSDDSNESMLDKAKDATSDATGTDYSDKDMRTQMELQAVDVALDATPGAGQANAARKGLKNFNKAKKEMGGKEGISDKVEEKVDDALVKGVRGLQAEAATKATGAGLVAGQAAQTGANVAGGAKAMAATAASNLTASNIGAAMWTGIKAGASKLGAGAVTLGTNAVTAVTSVFTSASAAVSSAVGTGVAASNVITASFLSLMMGATSIIGVTASVDLLRKDDGTFICVPEFTEVASEYIDYQYNGEEDAMRDEMQRKIYSVLSYHGVADNTIAGILGNFQVESGIDPTTIETIYDEPFSIGPRKNSAISNSFLMSYLAPQYNARFPNIITAGTGIMQWTDTRDGSRRQTRLLEYADENGMDWYDIDLQIMYMLEGDDDWSRNNLQTIINGAIGNVDEETREIMHDWVINTNSTLVQRQEYARKALLDINTYTVDEDYADSILSGLNVGKSNGNNVAGAFHVDDGCGSAIKTHYGNQAIDGTGAVPDGLELRPWGRDDFPDELKQFYYDPADAGLVFGSAQGWADGVLADQCVALATSYFMRIYPDWNKEGRPTQRPFGNGRYTAGGWASHYGESVTNTPASGAVFSDTTTSAAGHTGIVQHVFANGDILIAEQNVPGYSGAQAPGLSYSWSFRVVLKDRYESADWTFFKPSGYEPQWDGGQGNM